MHVPRRWVICLALLIPTFASPGLAAQPAQKDVLVLDFRAIGVPAEVAREVGSLLVEQLQKRPGLRVRSESDIRELLSLERSRQLLGCEDDYACVVEATREVKAGLLLSGSVGAVGKSNLIHLVLIEAETATPLRRASETLDDLKKAPAAMTGLLSRLFGESPEAAAPGFRLKPGQKMSLAVFDLAPSGVPKEFADNLTQVLSVALKRIEGTSVVDKQDILAMLQLEQRKNLLGCEGETSCIAEIGGALGVDKMVVGHVGRLAESYVVSLRLIDPREGRVDSRVTELFQGQEDQLIRAVRQAGRRLLGIEPESPGQLAVSASQEEAEVFVDSQPRGRLPMPPLAALAPGRHLLRVAKDGYQTWLSDIYVDPGETTAVWVKLDRQPERWYQKWWVWSLVGAVVVGVTTTAIVLAQPGDTPLATGQVTAEGL